MLEVFVVLAVLSILVTMAMVSHDHVVNHARGVEAEVVLAEINRLETLYHTHHGIYSDDVAAIGLTAMPTLKYYKVEVRVEDGEHPFKRPQSLCRGNSPSRLSS